MSIEMYDKFTSVSTPRTYGRGIHFIYSDNKRLRRHARNFLKWHIRRCEKVRNIRIKNGSVLIPGEVHTKDGRRISGLMVCDTSKESFYVGCFGEQVGFLYENETKFISTNSMCVFGWLFFRDGVPNNYGQEAEDFDRMSLHENRYAYKIKHSNLTLKDEIVEIAKKEHCHYLDKLEAEKKYYEIARKDRLVYEYAYEFWKKTNPVSYMKYVIGEYHARIMSNVEHECNRTRSTSGNSCRQLRALGFVA